MDQSYFRLQQLVNQIAQRIHQSLKLEDILTTTVEEIREFLETDRVLIYRIGNDGTGSVITENVLSSYPQIIGETFAEEVFPQEYHQIYIQGKILAINDTAEADIESCLIEFLQQFDVKAKLVVPIIQEIRNQNLDDDKIDSTSESSTLYLWGLLIAHQCEQPRVWQAEEIESMKQLSTQVAIAVKQSELYTQLQDLNTKLEQRVQKRTQELALTNESLKAEIRERQKTEAALRHSEERFRQVVENALDLITILDQKGNIYYQSPSVTKILGYTRRQFITQDFYAYIHPEDLSKIHASIEDALKDTKIARPIEFRCKHQDNSWHHLEAITQKFIDDIPETRIVITSRDISERKRLEEVHLALQRQKELNMVKTRFFAMASHEFRTPLSTVLAAAQVLENASQNLENAKKWLRNLHRIKNSVKNMVQLLDDILTINRAETGNLEFNPKPLALKEFCRQFVEEIQISTGSKHQLKFICKGKNTDAYFCLDEKLLRSILENLLSNAIKYSPQGSLINFRLNLTTNKIILQVKDQGLGISKENQAEIFEPFYRGQNVHHLAGTGLGLVVVKKCVDMHSGTINITSKINQGTTIIVTLPSRFKK